MEGQAASTGTEVNAAQSTETQSQAAQTQTTQVTQTTTPETWVNPDGTLKDGWKLNAVPQDFRGRKVYDAVGNNLEGLLKHIGNQDTLIGKQGKGIFVPSPEATETEKDMFFKAIGRPDTPQSYKLNIPDTLKDHYNDEKFMSSAKGVFHKAGLTQAQVDAVVAVDNQRIQAGIDDIKANPMDYYEELLPQVQPIYKEMFTKELQKRWGDSYQAREHLFKRAIAENTTEGDERELLLVRIEQDPLVADLLATMMNKHFTSGTGPDPSIGNSSSALNVDQRIDELMRDPNYMDGRTNPGRHKYIVEEVQRLMAQKRK
jgi:hypothetical protein